jgi:hypothetical protein
MELGKGVLLMLLVIVTLIVIGLGLIVLSNAKNEINVGIQVNVSPEFESYLIKRCKHNFTKKEIDIVKP